MTRLLLEVAAIFIVFHWSASAMGSDRGQAGLFVAAIVTALTVLCERWRSGRGFAEASRSLGLGAPRPRGAIASLGVCGLLFLIVLVFVQWTETSAALATDSLWLLPASSPRRGSPKKCCSEATSSAT